MTNFRKFIRNGSIEGNQQFGNAIGDYDQQLSSIFERIKRLRSDDVRNLDSNLRIEFFGSEHPDHIQIALWHDAKKMAQQATDSLGIPTSKSFARGQSGEERVHFDQSLEVPTGYTLAETPDGDEVIGKYVPGTGPGSHGGLSAEEIRQLLHDMYGRDNWLKRLERSLFGKEPIVSKAPRQDSNRPVHTLGKYVPSLDQIQITPGFENDPKVLAHEAAHRMLEKRLKVSRGRSIESILGDYVSEYWANRGAQELRQNAFEYVHGERVDDPNEVVMDRIAKQTSANSRARKELRKHFDYLNTAHELLAFGLQTYMTDPQHLQSNYPVAAEALRAMINDNPRMKRQGTNLLQLASFPSGNGSGPLG